MFDPAAAVSTSNITLRLGVPQDSSRHVNFNQDDPGQLPSAGHSRTPDESPNSIVLESPQAQLQTGN